MKSDIKNKKILKDLPCDQYFSTKCKLMPEIFKIGQNKGIIEFKCQNHGEIKKIKRIF